MPVFVWPVNLSPKRGVRGQEPDSDNARVSKDGFTQLSLIPRGAALPAMLQQLVAMLQQPVGAEQPETFERMSSSGWLADRCR